MNNKSGMKSVRGVYEAGSQHWVGDGFPVRNLFPSTGLQREVDPFLMLDYAGPAEFGASERPAGVGEHPHRGFETVTIAYQGSIAHRDSAGNAGVIHPGDVQWMTAASGVVHEEKHEREFARQGGTVEMIQLWVNLPRAHKMSRPKYQTLVSASIPRVDFGQGSYARVIAGELLGRKGPASTFTPVNVFDLELRPGAQAAVPIPDGHNAAVFVRRGELLVNGTLVSGEAKLVLLGREGSSVEIQARTQTGALVLSGTPINEPIVSYGPFVMNMREEILQALQDYEEGRMGRLSPA